MSILSPSHIGASHTHHGTHSHVKGSEYTPGLPNKFPLIKSDL